MDNNSFCSFTRCAVSRINRSYVAREEHPSIERATQRGARPVERTIFVAEDFLCGLGEATGVGRVSRIADGMSVESVAAPYE